METLNPINAALRRKVAAGQLTEQDAVGLRERLGCLALNMTAVGKDGPVATRAAVYWLFHVRWRKLSLLPAASPSELERARPIWRCSEAAGFLRAEEGGMGFAASAWQVAFCVDYVQARPLDRRLLQLMCRPSFREVWRVWVEVQPGVVDEVVALLRTATNRTVRYRAATVLSWIAAPDFVDPLIAALDDPSGGVRAVAAQALAAIGDPRAILPIIELLRKPARRGHRALAETLSRFGESAVLPMIALLEDEQPHMRYWAIHVLGRLGDVRAVNPLISLLHREGEQGLRGAAITALGELGTTDAVPELIEALADRALRLGAAWALGRIGDTRAIAPLLAALADQASDAAYAPGIEDAFSQHYAAEATRRTIGTALVALADADTFDVFLYALREGAPEVRPWAVAALATIGGPAAVDLLLATLHNSAPTVRGAAAEAFGKLDEPQAVGPLIQALGDVDATVRVSAATALSRLGHWGGESVAAAFIAALEDVDPTVRRIAARALGALGDGRTVEPLIRALADSAGPQAEIIAALSKLGGARAIDPLIQLILGQPLSRAPQSFFAYTQAMRMLVELEGARAVVPLIQMLAEAPPDAADPVSSGNYWSRRRSAIEALGKLGDPRAVEPLIAALGDGEGGPAWSWERATTVQAAEALGQIGDPRALRALARAQHPRPPSDFVGRSLNQAVARSIRRIRERRTQ